MKITIDEVHIMLDELAAELPEVFFSELNGGVNLLPDVVPSPHARGDDLYILGHYCRGGAMGRYINIYYGSMVRVHGHLDREQFRAKLREVLRHEFRHHMESLGGERGLEKEDEDFIDEYLSGQS